MLISAAAAAVELGIAAYNGFPEFLKRISGKDFYLPWFLISINAVFAPLLLNLIICSIFSGSFSKRAGKLSCTDEDLMVIMGFDRYGCSGYYLLKAKIDKVIRPVTHKNDNDELADDVLVELNSDVPQANVDKYFEKNPTIERLVSFVSERRNAGDSTTVRDVIRGFIPRISIRTTDGLYVSRIISRMRLIINSVFWGTVGICCYFGFAKMIMGVSNQKPISHLSTMMMFFGIFAYCAYKLHCKVRDEMIKNFFVNKLIRMNKSEEKYRMDVYFRTQLYDVELEADEAEEVLRSYVILNQKSSLGYLLPKETFTGELLNSVHLAQAAALAAARAAARGVSGSDTSGCSSCGSSCSGCSGCGGCGGD